MTIKEIETNLRKGVYIIKGDCSPEIDFLLNEIDLLKDVNRLNEVLRVAINAHVENEKIMKKKIDILAHHNDKLSKIALASINTEEEKESIKKEEVK